MARLPDPDVEDPDEPWSGLDIEYIVSVDFGSFGFAACYCQPGRPETMRLIQNWSDNRAATDLRKNLAALLIDAKTKETVSMGFEAEERYNKSQDKNEADGYLYFQHFKPYLYSMCLLQIPFLCPHGIP